MQVAPSLFYFAARPPLTVHVGDVSRVMPLSRSTPAAARPFCREQARARARARPCTPSYRHTPNARHVGAATDFAMAAAQKPACKRTGEVRGSAKRARLASDGSRVPREPGAGVDRWRLMDRPKPRDEVWRLGATVRKCRPLEMSRHR
jgi:hypothetical protein